MKSSNEAFVTSSSESHLSANSCCHKENKVVGLLLVNDRLRVAMDFHYYLPAYLFTHKYEQAGNHVPKWG